MRHYMLFDNDLSQRDTRIMNKIVTATMLKNSADCSAFNLLIVIDGCHVLMSESTEEAISLEGLSVSDVKKLMIRRYHEQVAQSSNSESDVSYVMISSLTSIAIRAGENIETANGDKYHQDGRGVPLSTKITLLTAPDWRSGGSLHMLPLTSHFQNIVGKSVIDIPGSMVVTLDHRQSIVFNNHAILHAVDGRFRSLVNTRRSILMDRLNYAQGFNWDLLTQYFLLKLFLPKSIDLSPLFLAFFLNPKIKGKRFKSESEMTISDRTYRDSHLSPSEDFRAQLEMRFGEEFTMLAKQLVEDGLLIIPKYFTPQQMQDLGIYMKEMLKNRVVDPTMGTSSFSGSAHDDVIVTQELAKLAGDELLIYLMSYYFGHKVEMSDWRGYHQEPKPPMNVRAWGGDWHNDVNIGEIKLMLFPHDIERGGQEMHVVKGTNHMFWAMQSQSDSKYTTEEARQLSRDGNLTRCYGKQGTVVIFDPNGVHRGTRTMQAERDVITFNFVPAIDGAPKFDLKFSTGANEIMQQAYCGNEEITKSVVIKSQSVNIITKEQDESFNLPELVKMDTECLQYHDLKPRYQSEGIEAFVSFCVQHSQMDIMFDLDLPVALGDQNINRDVVRVALREQSRDHKSTLRLRSRMAKVFPSFTGLLNNERLRCILDSIDYRSDKDNLKLRQCQLLLADLLRAMDYVDSIQRYRTNLIYIYATLDKIYEINKNLKVLTAAMDVLTGYMSCVYIDDLTYEREKLSRFQPGF